MSAIFGFWNLDGRPADPALLGAMSRLLAHRGPDGWDAWYNGPVALGHRMFRVTPESLNEEQPLVSRDGLRVLTADLRLDNRDELIRRFRLSSSTAPTISDAELLLRAYEECSQRSPEGLLGAFAFAAWDCRRHELFCARDHFGEKPLYYCYLPGRLFAFASEIKALWALAEVPDEINDLEVARHLMIPVCEDMGATYYRAVRRLPAGSRLSVTATRLEERAYWSLDSTLETRLPSDDDYADAVRDAFTDAVRCRMRARGPLASMLSGGLDSSSVTCVAARLLAEAGKSQRLRTLSAVFPDVPQCDERKHIQRVLATYDLDSSFFDADQVSPIADIHSLNWHGDGANKAGNLYLNWTLYRTAAMYGARVVLDGYDGDSTLSHGQGWLAELALTGRWWRLGREVKAKADILGEPWVSAVLAWYRAYGVPRHLRTFVARVRPVRAGRADLNGNLGWRAGLAPDFAARLSRHIKRPESPLRTDRERHIRLMTRPALIQTLDWIEATAAGAGVEVRCPFFDVRLVELCISLPGEQKLVRGLSRVVMRRAMAGILPEEIGRRRDKSNIEPGFLYALRSHSKAELSDVVEWANGQVSRFLDPVTWPELHRRFVLGASSPADSLRYWRMCSFALWLMGSNGARTTRGSRAAYSFEAAVSRRSTLQEV